MVFFTETWKPTSIYDRIRENASLGLHTLILLDIKVKEASLENMMRGRGHIFEPPRYMTVAQCCSQLIEIEEERKEGVYSKDGLAVGAARMGAEDQQIVAGTLEELCEADLGRPLHSVVLLGRRTHDMEREFLREFAVDPDKFDRIWKTSYAGST
jgi:diphthine methyl ester synthase